MNTRNDLDFKYVVQSVLNYVLRGNFLELSYNWQVFANRKTAKELIDNRQAKILHYVGALPWKDDMRNIDIWRKYA